jgi:hypothetical protein
MTTRSKFSIRLALLPAIWCGAIACAYAQVTPGPVVDPVVQARLAAPAPLDRAPGGRPISQTTWCKATGLGPTVKAKPNSAMGYGPSIRLRTQIGPCSIEAPAF